MTYHIYTVTEKRYRQYIDVKEPILRWAIDRSGMSVDVISRRPNIQMVKEWLQGTRKPTRIQLEVFARHTNTPFEYLLLSEPPQSLFQLMPHFRTIKNDRHQKRSINLEAMIGIIKQRQIWAHDYIKEMGVEPLAFVGSVDMDDDPTVSADKMRESLGLAQDWTDAHTTWESAYRYLQTQMENAGIFLSVGGVVQNDLQRRLNPMDFRGFVLADDYAPFVFVNGADIMGAQMFTLSHGMAHVLIGDSASFDLHLLSSDSSVRLESACNRMASEFLVPTKKLLSLWDVFAESSDGVYNAISNYFKVSRIIAARRALDTGCISYGEFYHFYIRYIRQALNWKKPETLRYNDTQFTQMALNRIGKRFMRTVIGAVNERRLYRTDAYHLTGLDSETFADIEGIMISDSTKVD